MRACAFLHNAFAIQGWLLYKTDMKFLFVHQNFPGQYLHVVQHLAAQKHQVVFITQRQDANLPGVQKIVYKPSRKASKHTHHYLKDAEDAVLNAQQVARVALDLKTSGFVPDLMVGHNGWGEIWYLKDVFPQSPLLGYFEFFYRYEGADVGFDPKEPKIFDTAPRIRTKNLGNLLALDTVDLGQCATQWQKSLYPARYHDMLRVVHEGINTNLVRPDPQATFQVPGKELALSARDEVLTYVARNLETYRGFPSFMRSLPSILSRRPKVQVVIVGGDEVSYGPKLANGLTFREVMLKELGDALDLSRVHFVGKLPYPQFLKVLQISSAHVYLTYPFVLSWSMLEAMSAGCLLIGSRTAPVQEVIEHGRNGLLVDFFSHQEIADTVVQVLEQPQDYAQLRVNARRTVVERYDLQTHCLPEQVRLLEETIGKRLENAK